MTEEEDYLLALRLQAEFDLENIEIQNKNNNDRRKRPIDEDDSDNDDLINSSSDLNNTQNLVHPEWETLDPTPDVKGLFQAFDNKFFQGRLKCVELEWSKRMYSCAGICYTKKNRFGLAITIRLSEPLLKLRPRKDLIETLLHEMIHAYLGVLGIKEGNGGHGVNFRKIMNGINKVAGTNITVYHSFYDEVSVYKTHWWRCNGICQNRSPFFGYVKRTSNRAPGPNDIWWKQHLESCGGYFLKIKEPESKKKAKIEANKKNSVKNPISSYFTSQKKNNKDFNNDNTVDLEGPQSSTTSKTGGNLRNVVGFRDLSDQNTPKNSSKDTGMFGTGYSLTSTSLTTQSIPSTSSSPPVDRDKLRNIWLKKFPSNSASTEGRGSNSDLNLEDIEQNSRLNKNEEKWSIIDDDVMIKDAEEHTVIELSDDDDDGSCDDDNRVSQNEGQKFVKAKDSKDRQKKIKQEILETSNDFCDLTENDIELLDDDYDDVLSTCADDADMDTSLVDDLFGEDVLLKDFNEQNAVISGGTSYHRNSQKDVVSCPICQEHLKREEFNDHLDGCSGITKKIVLTPALPMAGPSTIRPGRSILRTTKNKKNPPSATVTSNTIQTSTNSQEAHNLPINSLLNDSLDNSFNTPEDSIDDTGVSRRRGVTWASHTCPVCTKEVAVDEINEHLDICLK